MKSSSAQMPADRTPQVQLIRWVYKPQTPALGAVSVAIHAGSQMLALGLANGRVAIFSLPAIMNPRGSSSGGNLASQGSGAAAAAASLARQHSGGSWMNGAHGVDWNGPTTPAGPMHAQPLRVLSLSEWGYSSALLGPSATLRWSPDGRWVGKAMGKKARGR